MYDRIGANHVHRVLRAFRARDIAQRDDAYNWSLTQLGCKLQQIELNDLPERPAIAGPLWERIKPAEQEQKQDDPEGNQGEFHE